MNTTSQKLTGISCYFSMFFVIFSVPLHAEVILDGSTGTTGSLAGPDYQITESLGQRTGNNLFHSFEHFNLLNAETATFSGSTGIRNVISRVTGGQASSIDGTIRSTIPGASLYFINPSGILFGEHAAIDVNSSFHASTADYLGFKNGERFESRMATANPVFTTATPEAFGFLGETPAAIAVSGKVNNVLEVPQNKTLSLIGGNLDISNSSLYAPGGQINLVSAGSAGEVSINVSGVDTTSFTKMRNINISSAPDLPGNSIDVSANTAGRIFIRGNQLVTENTRVIADTVNGDGGNINIALTGDFTIKNTDNAAAASNFKSGLFAHTFGTGNAGDILLNINRLELTTTARVELIAQSSGHSGDLLINADSILLRGSKSSNPGIVSGSTATGNAGKLTVSSRQLELSNGAFIDTFTTDKGDAGELIIETEVVKIHDSAEINTVSDSNATGSGGNIIINTGVIDLYNAGNLHSSTFGKGNAGDITIKSTLLTANNNVEISNRVSETGKGRAGNVLIDAEQIFLQNGSTILDTTEGSGHAGDLIIRTDTLNADQSVISNTTVNSGHAGHLMIDAQQLRLSNGSAIASTTAGTGNSGNLTLNTEHLDISNTSSVSNLTLSSGNGGDLAINAGSLDIHDQGGVLVTSLNAGDSGNLLINAVNLAVHDQGVISSGSFENPNVFSSPGKSGNITLVATKSIEVKDASIASVAFNPGRDGSLQTNVGTSRVDSGNIVINAPHIQLSDNANIFSNTLNSGHGGNLKINADSLVLHNSSISASTQGKGQAGNIDIMANDILLNSATLESTSSLNIDVADNFTSAMSGNVDLEVSNTINIRNNSVITVTTQKANAGSIEISGTGIFIISEESKILTSVAGGNGQGGDISITNPVVSIDNSIIKATAVAGSGGNIDVTGLVFESPGSQIDASSARSMDGLIQFKPDTTISGSISILPGNYVKASELLSERCASRSGSISSSFVKQGRGSIPARPGDLSPSNYFDYTTRNEISHHSPASINAIDSDSPASNGNSMTSDLTRNIDSSAENTTRDRNMQNKPLHLTALSSVSGKQTLCNHQQ